MLKDIVAFFKREKFYTFLFFVFVLAVGFSHFRPEPNPLAQKNSEVLQKFKRAETRLQERIREAGSMQKYLEDHPEAAGLLSALTFFALGGLTLGLALDFLFLFSRGFRKRFTRVIPPRASPWCASMITKVILLFTAGSLITGFFMSVAGRFLSGEAIPSNLLILLHTTLMDILCFLFILYVIKPAGMGLKDLGFQIPETGLLREMFLGWVGYLAILPCFIILLVLLVFLSELMQYEPPAHPLVGVFLEEGKRSPYLIAYSIFLGTVIGPFFEEVFFRGLCYSALKARWGTLTATLVSAGFFALIHENSFAFWPIFVLGCVLALLYEKRGSLIAPITLHITHNAVFITYFFLAKKWVGLEANF